MLQNGRKSGSSLLVLVSIWLAAINFCRGQSLQQDADLSYDHDLASFVSRPDIRAPLWHVTKHGPSLIAPGYWFVTPYTDWNNLPDRLEYTPYQVGPHIYDGDGNLVWSGAVADHNRNAYDFKPFTVGNETGLSYMLGPVANKSIDNAGGLFVMMDASYTKTNDITSLPDPMSDINSHEFTVLDNGCSALLMFDRIIDRNSTDIPGAQEFEYPYLDDCIMEIDIATRRAEFEWCPLKNGVSPEESFVHDPSIEPLRDYFHGNSVDKFQNGDYLLSGRHVSTLYRISRVDGSILWRLGGRESDFVADFNFSMQHDARVVSENSTTIVLTLLDNAINHYEGQTPTSSSSSAKMIALYTTEAPMRAELLRQWNRPDGELSKLRGNVQMLENGNTFVGWSKQGYISEHTSDGKVVLEAQFTSSRFSTYRAYKSPFVGSPSERPAIKSFRYGTGRSSLTVSYVSWNGATEVATWMLKGYNSGSDLFQEIGRVPKKGFETVLTTPGSWSRVSAVALDAYGEQLGESEISTTILVESQMSSGEFGGAADTITLQRSTVWILAGGFVVFSFVFYRVLSSSWFKNRGYMRLS
ncbi:hypothetical protein MBLNU457_g0444t1 [Dothideomycetes sp. NU457]